MPRNCDQDMSRIPPGASNLILTHSALPSSLVIDGMPSSIIPRRSTRGNLPSTPRLPAVGFLPLHQSSRPSAINPHIGFLPLPSILPPFRPSAINPSAVDPPALPLPPSILPPPSRAGSPPPSRVNYPSITCNT